MTVVDAKDGYRLWSRSYDSGQNPVTALERRMIASRLGPLTGRNVIDIATGTGFWLNYAIDRGAHAVGIDLSPEMLSEASQKPSVRGRVVQGDMRHLPFEAGAADIAICSLAIGYVSLLPSLFMEMARVARTIIVSDLHEYAAQSGWCRAFESAGNSYQIESIIHTTADIDAAAQIARLQRQWRIVASFDEPEREIFACAGKLAEFDQFQDLPAILCTCWSQS